MHEPEKRPERFQFLSGGVIFVNPGLSELTQRIRVALIDVDMPRCSASYTPSSRPANSGYAGSGPTSVTNALSQTTYYCYDLTTGLLVSTKDPNNQTVSYAYDDVLRTTQINYPDGGLTTSFAARPDIKLRVIDNAL